MSEKPNAQIIAEDVVQAQRPLSQWPEHNRNHSRTLMGVLLEDWNCIRCWIERLQAKAILERQAKEPPSSLGMWVVDPEQDSPNYWMIRHANGSTRGDMQRSVIALVYARELADEIVARRNFRKESP